MKLRYIPIALSAIITAAHFMREGSYLITALVLFFPLLGLIKRSWIRWLLVWYSGACAIVWIATTRELISQRILVGEDYTRMALILGAVTLLCVGSGILIWTDKKYGV